MTSCFAPRSIASRTASSMAIVRSAIMVRHYTRILDPETLSPGADRLLGLVEGALALLVHEKACSRVVKVRNVRDATVGHGAAERDELSSATGTIGFHG